MSDPSEKKPAYDPHQWEIDWSETPHIKRLPFDLDDRPGTGPGFRRGVFFAACLALALALVLIFISFMASYINGR